MRPPSTLLQPNAILVLFCAAAMLFTNEADGQQDTLGLGGFPVPAEKEEIDLPSGYVLVNDKDKFDEYYKDAKVKPCNVDFDKDGNIQVFYDDLASTKGCTVDLLVNIADDKDKQIKFEAKVEDKEKNCVTAKDDNVLPFIFNEANNDLTTLTDGPEYGGDEFCANKDKCKEKPNKSKCIKRTMFQIGWIRRDSTIIGFLNQVAEPISAWTVSGKSDEAKMDVKMAVGNVPENKPLVKITALDVQGQSVEFPDGGILNEKPVCNHPRKATPPPAIWKVKSENKEFESKYFVTFHFFPQKSSRVLGKPDISLKGGPKCKGPKQPSFIFQKDFALGVLAITKPQPTTTKTTIGSTTTTTEILSTTATEILSTMATEILSTTTEIKSTTTTKIRTTKAMTNIRPAKTTTKTGPGTAESTASTTNKTTTPGTTEPADGPPLGMITGIVYVYLLVITIIVAVEGYCLFCRKRKKEFVPTEYFYITRRERALMAAADETTNE